jgi:hypothetical protein
VLCACRVYYQDMTTLRTQWEAPVPPPPIAPPVYPVYPPAAVSHAVPSPSGGYASAYGGGDGAPPPYSAKTQPLLTDSDQAELAALKNTVRRNSDGGAVDAAQARIAEIEARTGVSAHETNI